MTKNNFSHRHGPGNYKRTFFLLKVTVLCLFLGIFQLQASSQLIRINLKDVSLKQIIWTIEQQSKFVFMYSKQDLDKYQNLSVDIKSDDVESALKTALKDTELTYVVQDNVIVLKPQTKKIEKVTIGGIVKDKKGIPLPGVTVVLKGTTVGVVTNEKGAFILTVSKMPEMSLVFSFVGMKTKVVPYTGKKNIIVIMEEDIEEMEEVVVTGIFNKAKESFTGAATLITKNELKQFKSNNLLRTLNNIDPSFNVLQNNEFGSDPNKLPEINIRGTTSIPSDIQSLQEGERANLNTPLFIMDGFEITLERMMDLDPEEIESITILKDASSTAIYGSRGSNGVVVLTSVKPEAGKLRVQVAGGINLEISDLSSYKLLNAKEKLEIEQIAGFYNSKNPENYIKLQNLYNEKLRAVLEGVDTYWLDKPLRTGVGQNYRLSLSGGDAAFRYSLSASYNKTAAVMKGSYRDNFNGTFTVNYFKDKISFANSISIGLNKSANSPYGDFQQYVKMNPYWEIYDEDGEMISEYGENDKVTGKIENPLYIAQLNSKNDSKYTSIRNSTNIEWRPIKAFKLGFRFGISQQFSESDIFQSPLHPQFKFNDVNKKGMYNYSNNKNNSWNVALNLSYAKVINQHSLFAGVDFSLQENKSVSYGMSVTGFTHDKFDFISMGSKYSGDVPSGNESKSHSLGAMTNLSYNYKSMIFLDASLRLDGASAFGENGRFKPYYSLGAGWTISRLQFFQDYCPWLSTWRVRYNYGVSGSLQFSSPYEAMTVYEYDLKHRYDGMLGTTIVGYGNPDLSWQYTYSHNVGMDMSFFENRISLSANYYRKKTEGLSSSMSLPLSHGYSSYKENQGDIENTGIDANISVRILQRDQFSWSARAAIAHNRNKILKLSKAMKEMSANAEKHGLTDPNYLYREGESMDALYVVPSLGIDPNTGREIYIDKRGNPTYTWQPDNRKSYGVRQPKVNMNFSTSVRYKGLNVTASFSARMGGKIYNSTLVSKVEQADLRYNVDERVFSQRWQKPGDHAKFQALNPEVRSSNQSSRFVQSERTFQFASLNVNYNFGEKILDMFHLKGGSFSVSMNDLLYLSTVKRERGTQYPYSYKPRFTLSLTF